MPVDARVAVAAWRYTSRSRGPKVTHDVSILLGDTGPAWDCTCESMTMGEGKLDASGLCIHAADARRRWVASGHHDWMRRPRIPYPFCRSCGAVRQADGHIDAAPCRRPPGISLRGKRERINRRDP